VVEKSQEVDPFKADAAIVFRSLRDEGPASARSLMARCFPVEGEMPDTTRAAIAKRSMRRVQDSIIWMRHQGVTISCVPDNDGSVFHLGEVSIDAVGRSYTLFTGGKVVQRGSFGGAPVLAERDTQPVTEVAQQTKRGAKPKTSEAIDAQDVWHGRG
jgi:hypothetical protein